MKRNSLYIYAIALIFIILLNIAFIDELKYDLIFIDMFLCIFFIHILRSDNIVTTKTGIYIGILNYFILGVYTSYVLTEKYSNSASRVIVFLSLLTFFLFYEIAYKLTKVKGKSIQQEFDYRKIYILCNIVLWCVILLNMYVNISSFGGITEAFNVLYSDKSYIQSNYLVYTYHIVFPAFLYMYIYIRIIEKKRINAYILMCAIMCMLMLLIMKSRGNIVEFACSMVLVEILRSNLLKIHIKKIRLFLCICVVAIVVIVVGITRDNSVNNTIELKDSIEENIKGSADDIDVFNYIVEIHPSDYGFLYGRTFISGILSFVPRTMWEQKPVSYGNQIMIYKYGKVITNYAVAPSYIGEWYANFGFVGVCIGAILIGVFTKRIDGMKKNPINIVVLIITMFTMWRLMRGDFQNVYVPYVIKMVFIALMIVIGSRKQGKYVDEGKN